MIMFLAFVVVVFLSVRMICQSNMIGKVAHLVLAVGMLEMADNIENNQALMRSCLVVAFSFVIFMFIFMFKGTYDGQNRRNP